MSWPWNVGFQLADAFIAWSTYRRRPPSRQQAKQDRDVPHHDVLLAAVDTVLAAPSKGERGPLLAGARFSKLEGAAEALRDKGPLIERLADSLVDEVAELGLLLGVIGDRETWTDATGNPPSEAKPGPDVYPHLTMPQEPELDGMLWADAHLLQRLEALASQAAPSRREAALVGVEALRAMARERWQADPEGAATWWPVGSQALMGYGRPPEPRRVCPALRLLARGVWAKLRAEPQERLSSRPVAAMPKGLLSRLGPIRSAELQGRQLVGKPWGHGGPIQIATFDQKLLPNMMDRALKGAAHLGGLDYFRLIYWLAYRGHHQWVEGYSDPRVIAVEGGFSGLAKQLGRTSQGAATMFADLLHAMACLSWELGPDITASGGLLSFTERGGHRGQRSKLEIVLGSLLMPTRDNRWSGDRRNLIPLGVNPLFPVVGARRHYPTQQALGYRVMMYLRDHATELAIEGSVELPPAVRLELADEVELPSASLKRVWEKWTEPNLWPFLQQEKASDRYKLGPDWQAQEDFIKEGGGYSKAASNRGKQASKAKRAKAKQAIDKARKAKK